MCLVAIGALAMAGQAQAHQPLTPVASYRAMRAPTTLLVTPQGSPVGGKWQRWVDLSRVPTVDETVVFYPNDTSGCLVGADGCAVATPPTVYLAADAQRPALYHELGHLFDFAILTDAERLRFMRIWHWRLLPGESIAQAWWRGEDRADSVYGHGPPVEWFAEGYRLCATFARWTWNTAFNEEWYQYGYPAQLTWDVRVPKWRQRWALHAQQQTCRLIRSAAFIGLTVRAR